MRTVPPAEEEALAFLASRIDYERATSVPYGNRDFRLDRMRELLARLGNPQEGLRIVHVAGTKGKGSTSAMIAAALTAAGYRTGLYSSPHLNGVEERFMIDGAICPRSELARLVEQIRPVVARMDAQSGQPDNGPTYFELTTAIALMRFAEQRVDAAVLEVGMGGRLDSTNVCRPLVSVITSISYDHTQQLGDTLTKIAREKAGIIKPGVPVTSGVVPDEPRDVIVATARQRGCRLTELGRDFEFDYRPPRALDRDACRARIDFLLRGPRERRLDGVELALVGRHQGANAALALATLDELSAAGLKLPETALRRGLAHVGWPARVEILRRAPAVVLDSAHNVASVEALVEVLEESFVAPRRLLVFATTRDKDAQGMLQVLLPRFDEVIFTRYWTNPRSVPPEELECLAADLSPIARHVRSDPAAAWRLASALATPEHLVCITGSLFMAAEMRTVMGLTVGASRAVR